MERETDKDGPAWKRKISDISYGRKQTNNINFNHSAVDTAFLYRAMFSWFPWFGYETKDLHSIFTLTEGEENLRVTESRDY